MARDPADERKTVALEQIAASMVRLDERAEVLLRQVERALDLAERALWPGPLDRALRALVLARTARQAASLYRRAALLVGPSERDHLYAECLKRAASCVGASAWEGEVVSAAFARRFRLACDGAGDL